MSNLDTQRAVSTRREHARIRFEALLSLRDGLITLQGFFNNAVTSDGRALAQIQLTQLLSWMPGWRPADAELVRSWMLAGLDLRYEDHPPRMTTVRWLLDQRSGGRRWEAFWLAVLTFEAACDYDDSTARPWPGFPFSKVPS